VVGTSVATAQGIASIGPEAESETYYSPLCHVAGVPVKARAGGNGRCRPFTL
jgi:hypothetical protein